MKESWGDEIRRAFGEAKFLRPFAAVQGAIPLLVLVFELTVQKENPNQQTYFLHQSGTLSLFFILATLAVTPIRHLLKWNALLAVRRPLGLWAFAYALVHLGAYVVFNQEGRLNAVWSELLSRQYLQWGAIAVALMVPLAATSTDGMIRRLGSRNWRRLHWLTYWVAPFAILHFGMSLKADITEPAMYFALFCALVFFRIWFHLSPASPKRRPQKTKSL